MAFVVDASAVLAWLMPDEFSEELDAHLDRWKEGEEVYAPSLLRYEVANALVSACFRKKRITQEEMVTKLAEFDGLEFVFDDWCELAVTKSTVLLSEKYSLSIYDASYLDLALLLGVELVTLDADLEEAAKEAFVELAK